MSPFRQKLKRLLSVLLALSLILSVLPAQVLAAEDPPATAAEPAEGRPPEVLQTAEGDISVDDSWDEVYPFGAFAFDTAAAEVGEGEDTVVTVYRVGGTRGRATAYIAYSPLLTPNEDGSTYYGYALRGDDLTIQVEDPLPVAQYQPVGKLPSPEHGDAKLAVETDEQGYVLRLDVEAEAFRWEVFHDGAWKRVLEADQSSLSMDAEYLDGGEYDYRCVYTKDGVRFCTDSVCGRVYEKEPEETLEPMPDDIVLYADPTFSPLDLVDENDMYSGWVFMLTFAEGEWKKEFRLHANTDEETECIEAATFRIVDTEGGEICGGAETFLYHVNDKNESKPSSLGFTVQTLAVDKAKGTAELLVRREGGNERAVTVEYATADGSALAGRDYTAASGTLLFYGNVTELPIKVQLIDDRIVSEEKLSFSVTLSELKGDDNCRLSAGSATVSLTNSGTGDGSNLATRLHDPEAVDLTATMQESPSAANAGSKPATGEAVEVLNPEPVEVPLEPIPSDSRLHTYDDSTALLNFTGLNPSHWSDKFFFNRKENYNFTGSGSYIGNTSQSTPFGLDMKNSFYLTGKGNAWATLKNTPISVDGSDSYYGFELKYAGQMFSNVYLTADVYYHGAGQFFEVTYYAGGKTHHMFSDSDFHPTVNNYSGYSNTYVSTGTQGNDRTNLNWDDSFSFELCLKNNDNNTGLISFSRAQLVGRREFPENAFTVDITTPNDPNNTPEGCVSLTEKDYANYFPNVSILTGGTSGTATSQRNILYVGSTLQFAPKAIPGLAAARVDVLSSTDGGKTWTPFDKFDMYPGKNAQNQDVFNVVLAGNPGAGKNLVAEDLAENKCYRFRVVYERRNTVTVDLAPSLPRDANGNADANGIEQLFNNYNGEEDHCFGDARIVYGYSIYDPNRRDYNAVPLQYEVGEIKEEDLKDTSYVFNTVNLQWINFGLPQEDLLVCNGKAYAGNETIYLTKDSMAGDITFSYYHSAYQGYVNAMTTFLSWSALYFDRNGDGRINGSYNPDNGLFTLDETKDEFVCFLNNGMSWNEMELTPVRLEDGSYAQYFIQACYTMTPRCLTVPSGESEDDRAQILPAFTSAIDPGSEAYHTLTSEQRGYTYVVSGQDEDDHYSSDDHLMYRAEASAKAVLSFPLGGDKSPAHLNEENDGYEWEPDWIQNNLFALPNPEMVIIQNSVAGPTEITDDYTLESESFHYVYGEEGLKQINGYLASMTGTSTFVLVSQIQQMTTPELLVIRDGAKNRDATPPPFPQPNSVTVGSISTTPDALYLGYAGGSSSQPLDMNTGGDGESEMPEFSTPFNLNLGANEVALTDYITIIMNDNQVGFAISLPLVEGDKEHKSDDMDGKGASFAKKESWTKFKDFFTDSDRNDKSWKDCKNLDPSKDKVAASGQFSAKLSFCTAFIWQYNPLDNGYYFYTWEIGLVGELEFRGQIRFTACPLLYGFLDVKFSVELKTGLTCVRQPSVDKDHVLINAKTTSTESNKVVIANYSSSYQGDRPYGEVYSFQTQKKAFNLRFKGKVFVDVLVKDDQGEWTYPDKNDKSWTKGILTSGGGSDTQVVLHKQDGMDLDEPVLVRIWAMDHDSNTDMDKTELTYLAPIKEVYDFVHWNGIVLAPKLAFEIGMGFGVELAKAEIYLHISVGAEFNFCHYRADFDPDTDPHTFDSMYDPAKVNNFDVCIGIALRVVFLFFSYELDLVSYQISYDGDEDEWTYGWHFLNDFVDPIENSKSPGVTVRLPKLSTDGMKLYRPEDNAASELRSFTPNDPNVPFQISGYGSSMDAASLSSGIPEGSSYKVVRAGEKNYIVYTYAREGAPEDSTMLVLSELGYQNNAYGLVNPAGAQGDLYLILDNETEATGDLDFDVWADGETIRVTWTSYAAPAATSGAMPELPTAARSANKAGAVITAENYRSFAEDPAAADWYEYYLARDDYAAYLLHRAKKAARNTVVKTASWTPGESAFSAPETVTANSAYNYVFLPASAGDGSVIFFGSTAAEDDGTAMQNYAAYQSAKGLPEQIQNYLNTTKQARLDLTGIRSALNLAVKSGGSWSTVTAELPEGQTLANVEFTQIGSAWYAAYSTEQTEYEADDMITVYRLYLRKAELRNGTPVWGQPYLIRELRDYDRDKAGQDGVYTGGALMAGKDYDSPYLANLRFLTANLDESILVGGEPLSKAVSLQTLLVFEMNGGSYILPQTAIESITAGNSGLLYPFFTPPMHENADGTEVQEGSSGKLQVDINADADGNLYAVYVGTVEGTTSNAVFLSAYDAAVNAWGDGAILAMHDMNVYEAAARNGWDHDTTEAAYLWGGLSQLEEALTALYGEEAVAAVKAAPAYELGDAGSFQFSELQTVQGANGELLLVVQGSSRTNTVKSYTDNGETKYVLTPSCNDETGMEAELGTYVISFGQSSPNLGQARISFADQEFSAGSELVVSLDAVNTGLTSFRGSETEPITASLTVKGQTIAAWEIEENIVSGQKLELFSRCAPLAMTLSNGDSFSLTVSECSEISGTAAEVSIELFTVTDLPDLSVENFSVAPARILEDGKKAKLDISFVAANLGSEDATNAYAQFSYVSGYDDAGDPIWAPLDLSDHELQIGLSQPLDTLLNQKRSEADDLRNGILKLVSTEKEPNQNAVPDLTSNLYAGCGKRVSGSITLPAALFSLDTSRHAEIRVELFSDADTISSYGDVIEAIHGEYCTTNNSVTKQVEAWTNFTAAHNIRIPLGSTTKIPFSAVSSRCERPSITVKEIEDEDGFNIGILNFRQSAQTDGALSGLISISPMKTGTGVIHVTDVDTNSTFAIAFEVTENTDGIDIYNDNDAFSFYNTDGSAFDNDAAAPQSWKFHGYDSWGETAEVQEVPMRGNLSVGDQGAWFTFDTVAESIDLYFLGEISVSSTNPDFEDPGDITNTAGGSSPTTIDLGENADNSTYTVTVHILSRQAFFDRLVEHYAGGVIPVPAYDGTSPLFIWSRSFPDTASVKPGTSIPLKVYVLDNNGIGSLTVDKIQVTDPYVSGDAVESLDSGQLLWCYDFGKLSKNAEYTITAMDLSGNQTTTVLQVDWFMSPTLGDVNTVPVPLYTPEFWLNDEPLGDETIPGPEGLTLRFTEDVYNTKRVDNQFEVYSFDGNDFRTIAADENGNFPIAANGIYWARTVNQDSTWSAAMLNITQIDLGLPSVSLEYNAETGELEWNAGKVKSGARITKVTLNDYELNTKDGWSFSGSLPVSCNGVYTLCAVDGAGHSTVATLELEEIPLSIDGAEAAAAWNLAMNNGSILLKAADVHGGHYVDTPSAELSPADYHADYEIALAAGTWDPADSGIVWEALETERLWDGLAPGLYSILVRDAADPEKVGVLKITVPDESIRLEVHTKDVSGNNSSDGEITVTAVDTAGEMQFALIPAKTLGEAAIEDYVKTDAVQWLAADQNAEDMTHSFTKLSRGLYYVAVRRVLAPDNDAWYAAHPEAWDRAKVLPVTIDGSHIVRVSMNDNSDVEILIEEGCELTESDQQAVRIINQNYDVILDNGEVRVLIRKGTLQSPDFDLNRLIVDVTDAKDGMVVAYTDLNGTGGIAAFGIVTDGAASYVAIVEGDYRIQEASASFNDIEGRWGEEAILFTAVRQLFEGTGDGAFSPDNTMTRAMFVTVLWAMAGRPEPIKFPAFEDLTQPWYQDAVAWACENGIMTGYSSTTFGPNRPITREQICVVLVRFMEYLGWKLKPLKDPIEFEDSGKISKWAKAAVDDCTQMSLMVGVGGNRFAPRKYATRMECASVLAKFIRLLVEQYAD